MPRSEDYPGDLARDGGEDIFDQTDPPGRAISSTYGAQIQSAVIFDKIFKNDKWIQEVIGLDNQPNPSPVVALVGCDLFKLYHNASTPTYLALVISDWSGDSCYYRKQLLESFKDQGYAFDGTTSEVHFPRSKITLHIGDAIQGYEWIRMRDPGKLFKLHKKELRTAAVYFGDDTLYHIGPDLIGGVDDFSVRKKRRIRYICSIRLRWGDGSPICRIVRASTIPFSLVSKRVQVEDARQWISSWRLARADENNWQIIDV